MPLEIIYSDAHLVAINKPHGLLVHRSKYADEARVFAVQELRNQLETHVYPCHRIDRKTSGVLLFALNETTNSLMQQLFADNQVKKTYLAIVRGYTPDQGTIDYPLTNDKGKIQEALTLFNTLQRAELEVPFGKFATSRYSLVEARPQTGRMHQLRKHFAHIFHPIIGDRPHGCNKQNRLFKERWQLTDMLLHARELEFIHPVSGQTVSISATPGPEFQRMMALMGWQ
ncbi:MAG: pseudouridine synthase [Salinivirgaceae bacterium]